MKKYKLISIKMFITLLLLASCNAPLDAAPSLDAKAVNTVPPVETLPVPEIDAPIVDFPAIVSIDMLDETNGWAVTETQIVRTNDGGVTWYNVSPQGPAEFSYSANSFFLDSKNAWVLFTDNNNYPNAGTLYRTTDGGSNWQMITAPFSSGEYVFLDSNDGWAMADFGVGAGNMAVAVFQTTDGGTTWTRTYANDPTLAGSNDSLPLSGLKNTFEALNMQTAFIGGLTYASGEAYLYETNNAGKTWQRVTLRMPDNTANAQINIDDIKFLSANDGYFMMRLYMEILESAIYVTHDAGKTWSLTPTLIADGGSQVFLSATEALVYTPTQFQVTRDAGMSWTSITPDILFSDSFAGIDFANLNTGWIVTIGADNKQKLFKTEDGGASWSQIVP